jgi:hydroxyacylglutathione hydrolase
MIHYISRMNKPGENTDVHVETVGPFQENTWFLRARDANEVVVIDPGDEPEQLIEVITARGWKPVAILNTHGHIDHVGAAAPLQAHFQIPFHLHSADQFLLDTLVQTARTWGVDIPEKPTIDVPLDACEPLELAGLSIRPLFTPGHTPGGVSLAVDGRVFAGDCLFMGSIGRTDFPGSDTQTLMRSIRTQLLSLPDETIVHPGHGPDTTIGREREHNPFL